MLIHEYFASYSTKVTTVPNESHANFSPFFSVWEGLIRIDSPGQYYFFGAADDTYVCI